MSFKKRIRADKKKLEQACLEKIQDIENKIERNNQVVKQYDTEIKNTKQVKTHCKLQLKDLYIQTFANENDIT